MLYHNGEKLTKEKFQNPGSEYRAAPFWAWNCKMTEAEIDNTLDALKAMGMGGGHIHCRTGMDNPYMGEEFLNLVKYSWKKSREKDMLTWLYDEDLANLWLVSIGIFCASLAAISPFRSIIL